MCAKTRNHTHAFPQVWKNIHKWHRRRCVSSDASGCQLKSLALTVLAPHFITTHLCQTLTIPLPARDQLWPEPVLLHAQTQTHWSKNWTSKQQGQETSSPRFTATQSIGKEVSTSSKQIWMSYISQILSSQITRGFYLWLTDRENYWNIFGVLMHEDKWHWMN